MRTDTASGVSTTFEYDSYGNPTSASTFNHPFETAIYNNREYVLINKKSGMVMDICGVAEGEDRLGKRIIQYNNKRHIYQNFVVKPHPTNTACKMIEPVYQQEAYAGNPLHLGFIDAMATPSPRWPKGIMRSGSSKTATGLVPDPERGKRMVSGGAVRKHGCIHLHHRG